MFYEEYIDQKKTVQRMKRYLEFLGLHMNSVSYQEYLHKQYPCVVKEEDIMDYMNYSSSILHLEQEHSFSNKTLVKVIAKKDEMKKRKEERENQIRWLCYGIERLPEKERSYILERYVYHLDAKVILDRHGVVESTMNRNLRKGCLDLAIILKLEVMLQD